MMETPVLATSREAEFSTVRDALGVADSVLSKHLKVLADAGYVTVTKPRGSSRVRTWTALTRAGRRAYESHLAYLQQLVAHAARSTTRDDGQGAPGTDAG
ncbi:helix-turn-helix domain-containing protein [Streptomyces bathyalis]|uniref:Helix-turn-helix domain-containing protein n=1 Tax=Streptomyces bathyalis TaxID=2710756 RepID=A0A7T1TA17_9ACTN|nr:transcriptional regulator [Streptomyces bathyalis]QPP09094.1 helix-turn-helix domain-containing protein [Streptomyces bathyalis]